MTKQAIIVDLDGTIADLSHRLHHINGRGPKNWDAFFAKVSHDAPIHQTMDTVAAYLGLYEHVTLFFVSGRREESREDTRRWLADQGWPAHSYEALLMRPSGDFRADWIIKEEILDGILGQGYEIVAVFDDRPSVVQMWKRRGLHVFQVHAPGVEDIPDQHKVGTLNLLVGPSHAGKTRWWLGFDMDEYVAYLSSDLIRGQLTGDEANQTRNDEVFALMHTLTRTYLNAGVTVIYDATNIRTKDRIAAANLAPGDVVYHVFDRPLNDKLASLRPGFPESVVRKHHETFQSNLKAILSGDGLPNVTVEDHR